MGFLLYVGIVGNNQTIIIIAIVILLFFVLLVYWGLNAKVKITEMGIEYNSGFKHKFIEWVKIKSYGVYRVSRYDFEILERDKYDKFSIWGQKFIYISEYQDYFPKSFKKPKEGYIDFNYRKEAFREIERMITKACTQHRV
jgi:hypothetical protein